MTTKWVPNRKFSDDTPNIVIADINEAINEKATGKTGIDWSASRYSWNIFSINYLIELWNELIS